MERVETLIKRLLEQYDSRTDATAMLLTAQMLVHELQQKSAPAMEGKKVSVIHPGINATPVTDAPVTETQKTFVPAAITVQQPVVVQQPEEAPAVQEPARTYTPLPKIEEIPTFAYQQKEVFQIN